MSEEQNYKKNRSIAVLTFFVAIIMPIIGFFGIPLPATKNDIARLDKADVVLSSRIEFTATMAEVRRLETHIKTLQGDYERYILQKYQNLREQEAVKAETGSVPEIYAQEQAKIEAKLSQIQRELNLTRSQKMNLEYNK